MKFKRKLLSIILIMCMLFGMPTSVLAKDAKVNSISNEKLEQTIEGIIKWAKQGNEKLLNPEFLQMAGTTPGDWFPIGIGRYGYKDDYGAYLSAIEKDITERYKSSGKLHPVKATEWHRTSLAILAMGGDPTKIGVDPNGKPINLIEDGTYNCVGRRGVKGQGINGAIWSLISMDSLRYEVPEGAKFTREYIIKLILEEQLPDGGFSLGGKTADPDITGMTMQALAPYYNSDKVYKYKSKKLKDQQGNYIECSKTIKEVLDQCIDLMGKMQHADGDYFSWGTQNVESTVQILTALSSLGIDCEKDSRFVKNGKTLIDGIMKYRNERDGGFLHSYTYDPANPSSKPDASNNMASEQTLYGLISYWRLRNNMRNVYDFRPETNQGEFVIRANGNNYNIAVNKDKQVYSLELPSNVKSFSFVNIPMGPYDTSNISLNSAINVVDKNKIQIEIKNRKNETKKYEVNIKVTDEARVNDVINVINNLSETITLADEKKITEISEKFNNLSDSDKEKVTNIEKLNSAKQKLQKLKDELEKENIIKQKAILDKIEELPKVISIDDKAKVSELLNSLNALADFPKKKDMREKLVSIMEQIEEIESKVKSLDDKIFGDIDPMNITLKDKSAVLEIIAKYEKLNDKDRKHVGNYNDVLVARRVIEELENNKVIISDVFKNMMGSDKVYVFEDKTVEGKKYTITFHGSKIIDPTIDFNTKVSFTSKNADKIKKISKDATIISFAHEGKLPGKAKVTIDVDLKDGKYYLYYFNEKTNNGELVSEIVVQDGKTTFEISHCSDYFISESSKLQVINNQKPTNSEKDDMETEDIEIDNLDESVPKTGDNSNITLLIILCIFSGGIMLFLKGRSKYKV
ncbi:LPXTG cell wall anchor domain-containing protein [Hathewaya histolytica]|uniref:LPXTG cell wall anchor domain-containing protein n=1 Tax=Hathewaya histolytica TaxID=1498 RepID=UPI003B66E451